MRDMLFGIIAGVILAFILSFFDVDSWVMLHLIPDFLTKLGVAMYYILFGAVGGLIGYFAGH